MGTFPSREQACGRADPSLGPSCRHSALWPSSREALKSISLFKCRKFFKNKVYGFTDLKTRSSQEVGVSKPS